MDPIFSQLSKAALDKAIPATPNKPESPGTSFKEVLQQNIQDNGFDSQKMMEFVDKSFGVNQPVNETNASSIRVEFAKNGEVEATPKIDHFFELLNDINRNQNRFEDIIEIASSGKALRPQDLLSLQATTQLISMQGELVVKGADMAVRTIQSTINMQVGG